MQTYVLFQLLWIFPVYSILGWMLEVAYASIKTGQFVNRGFLNGCVCPIYGLGACLIILALTPVQYNFLLLFFGAMFFGSMLELVGGYVLMNLFHIRWWDYSNRAFNIGGYVCLEFSVIWGFIGLVLMHVVHPPIAYAVNHVPHAALVGFLAVFYLCLVVDMTATVSAVKKLNQNLQEITRLASRIRKGSDFVAKRFGTSAIRTAQRVEGSELASQSKQVRLRVSTATADTRVRIQAKLKDSARLHVLLNNTNRIHSRLIKAFPNMKAVDYTGALSKMKQRIKQRVEKTKRGDCGSSPQ